MLCTAANTSPVERGYTILQMVTSKHRNQITSENLEVLFLLGTLKIPVKNPEDCENERKRLEKKKWTLNYFLFFMRLYSKLVQKRKLKKKITWYTLNPLPPGKTVPPKIGQSPPKIAIGLNPPFTNPPPKSWGGGGLPLCHCGPITVYVYHSSIFFCLPSLVSFFYLLTRNSSENVSVPNSSIFFIMVTILVWQFGYWLGFFLALLKIS